MVRDLIPRRTEAHIRATPGVSDAEIEMLLTTLAASRVKVKPCGRAIWRTR